MKRVVGFIMLMVVIGLFSGCGTNPAYSEARDRIEKVNETLEKLQNKYNK